MSIRKRKLKKILKSLEEIEQLRYDLERILPRETNGKKIRGDSEEKKSNDWSLTESSSDLKNKSDVINIKYFEEKPTRVSGSVTQKLMNNDWDNPTLKNYTNESALTEVEESSKTSIEKITKSINASVQTGKRYKAEFDSFDILDYLRIPEVTEDCKKVDCKKEKNVPAIETFDIFHYFYSPENVKSPEMSLSSSRILKKQRRKESLKRNNESINLAPIEHANLTGISDKIKAAAALEQKTPAVSVKQQQHDQVHKYEIPGPEARSIGTRRDRRRDAVVRVPAKKHKRSGWKMMTEWASPIRMQSELARKMRDCTENKVKHKQKKISEKQRDSVQENHGKMIGVIHPRCKWSRVLKKSSDREETKEKPDSQDKLNQKDNESKKLTKYRRIPMKWRWFTSKTRDQFVRTDLHGRNVVNERFDQKQMNDFRKVNHFNQKAPLKKWRWYNLFSFLNCINISRRRKIRITVPDHYPGDRSPHLVGTESIIVLNDRAETLRVISSAAKICVPRSNKNHDHFFKFL